MLKFSIKQVKEQEKARKVRSKKKCKN